MKTRTDGWARVGFLAAAAGLLLAAGNARANNLRVTNVTVIGRDNSTAYVQFDIAWENSWRYTNINHDAAWVFFKVLPEFSNDWQHVTLEGMGHETGSGTPIELVVPADRVGLFVRRSGEGAGATAVQNVKAVWNFASNSLGKSDKVKIQAFGLEMVYVAEGPFKVGSGGTGVGELFEGGGGKSPFAITNAGPIPCSNEVGCLWGASTSGNSSMGGNGTLSNSFPNGFSAFYCMKYEVTEGQWVDFFNTLTDAQKTTRDITSGVIGGKGQDTERERNTVAWTTGDATTAARDRACNYLAWADGCALADWAGLRPMTELEFEKACRGPLTPVADEFAWGTTSITRQTGHSTSPADGSGAETATPASANCHHDRGISGPVRVGIYATNGASRVAAGASYWGVMELSGNLSERPVTIGNATGRAFTGLHGNGVLTTAGDADVTAWPPPGTAVGCGFRGGEWYSASAYERASDRASAAGNGVNRHSTYGWRAVRAAPAGVGP